MCDLCDADPIERNKAVFRHVDMAEKLSILSRAYMNMARGNLKPHGPEASILGPIVQHVARQLVEWWYTPGITLDSRDESD